MRLYPFYDQEGDIGGGGAPEATEYASEPSSVVTEDQESSGDGNAPTPDSESSQPTGEVERQQSFAQRLKEQTQKALAEERSKWEQETASIREENAYLDKIARVNGYRDRHEYKEALDQHLKQQEIDRQAQQMGIDPDTYAQYFAPVNDELTQLRQKVQTFEQHQSELQRQQQIQADWGALYEAFPTLKDTSAAFEGGGAPEWFNSEMKELVDMGYKPLHAYRLAHQDTLFRQKEQEVLARVTGRDQTQILPSNDRPNNMQFDPANMSFEEIQSISERVRRGERITF